MAKLFKVKVEGLDALKSNLNRYLKDIQKDVDLTLMEAVRDIGMTAKTNCKIQSIGQTIRSGKIDGKYRVTTEGETSVYLEFGTGNFAKTLLGNYPQDWKDMAMRFYINGLGRSAASPYLYPAYQKHAGEAVLIIEDKIERR
jgi:hypothetical protein